MTAYPPTIQPLPPYPLEASKPQTPAQKRNRKDWEYAQTLMAAASHLVQMIQEGEEMGLYLNVSLAMREKPVIKVLVGRELRNKLHKICNAEIGA